MRIKIEKTLDPASLMTEYKKDLDSTLATLLHTCVYLTSCQHLSTGVFQEETRKAALSAMDDARQLLYNVDTSLADWFNILQDLELHFQEEQQKEEESDN